MEKKKKKKAGFIGR